MSPHLVAAGCRKLMPLDTLYLFIEHANLFFNKTGIEKRAART